MSWEDYWLPHLVDWTLGAAGSAVVAWLVRRWLRTLSVANAEEAAEVRQRLTVLERRFAAVGDAISASLGHRAVADLRFRAIEQRIELLGARPARNAMHKARNRRTLAAALGVLLIAMLQFAVTSTDLRLFLAAVLPVHLGMLVPVLFGGAATVLAVWRAGVKPSAPAPTLEPSVPVDPTPMLVPAPAAATPPDDITPPTAGAGAPSVHLEPLPTPAARAVEPDAATSLVQLLPLPSRAFL